MTNTQKLAAFLAVLAVAAAGALSLVTVATHPAIEAAVTATSMPAAAIPTAAAPATEALTPVSSPAVVGATPTAGMMSEAEAIEAAAGDRPVTEPTRAKLMPIREAETVFETGVVDLVPLDTMVWVVTVHSPMTTMGSPMTLPKTFPVYSMAIDARTREGYGTGIGTDSLG